MAVNVKNGSKGWPFSPSTTTKVSFANSHKATGGGGGGAGVGGRGGAGGWGVAVTVASTPGARVGAVTWDEEDEVEALQKRVEELERKVALLLQSRRNDAILDAIGDGK